MSARPTGPPIVLTRRRVTPLHYVTYGLYRVWMLVLGLLPFPLLLSLARALGSVAWLLDARHRAVAARNVRQALGSGASSGEVRRLVHASFRHLFEVAAETLFLRRFTRKGPDAIRSRCALEGFERLEALRGGGRGILFVSGHLGSFEFLGATLGLFGYPLHTVSRPVKNPLVALDLARRRQAWGQRLVPKRGALRHLLPALRAGGNAAFLLDQNERKRPLFIPVFGRLAASDRSVAALSRRLGLPIVVVWGVRAGPGFRFKIGIEEVFLPGGGGRGSDEILARRVQGALERVILRFPDRYFWIHDRYRTRPPGERESARAAPAREDPEEALGCVASRPLAGDQAP